MIILASILMIAALIGVGVAVTKAGSFKGAGYRQAMFDNVVKPEAKRLHEVKQKAREESVVATIKQHWQAKINSHERRQARDTRRAARALAAGKNPAKYVQRSIRRDQHPSNPTKLRDKELKIMTGLRRAAQGGNSRAQQLSGKVHPKTGHTTGGIGGIGHIRPSHHMPKVRQPKQPKKIPGAGKAAKKAKNILVGKPRDPRRPPYDPRR